MAARAVSFAGYGREKVSDAKFSLETVAKAAIEEREARGLVSSAISMPDFRLPIWQSPLFRPHMIPIRDVAWSPDGKTLASGSEDHTVKLWEASVDKLISGRAPCKEQYSRG